MPHPCPVCGIPVEQRSDVGRPRVYCTDAHRLAAHRKRRAAREADLDAREADLLERAAALLDALAER